MHANSVGAAKIFFSSHLLTRELLISSARGRKKMCVCSDLVAHTYIWIMEHIYNNNNSMTFLPFNQSNIPCNVFFYLSLCMFQLSNIANSSFMCFCSASHRHTHICIFQYIDTRIDSRPPNNRSRAFDLI